MRAWNKIKFKYFRKKEWPISTQVSITQPLSSSIHSPKVRGSQSMHLSITRLLMILRVSSQDHQFQEAVDPFIKHLRGSVIMQAQRKEESYPVQVNIELETPLVRIHGSQTNSIRSEWAREIWKSCLSTKSDIKATIALQDLAGTTSLKSLGKVQSIIRWRRDFQLTSNHLRDLRNYRALGTTLLPTWLGRTLFSPLWNQRADTLSGKLRIDLVYRQGKFLPQPPACIHQWII